MLLGLAWRRGSLVVAGQDLDRQIEGLPVFVSAPNVSSVSGRTCTISVDAAHYFRAVVRAILNSGVDGRVLPVRLPHAQMAAVHFVALDVETIVLLRRGGRKNLLVTCGDAGSTDAPHLRLFSFEHVGQFVGEQGVDVDGRRRDRRIGPRPQTIVVRVGDDPPFGFGVHEVVVVRGIC